MSNVLHKRAKKLRSHQTDAEALLWHHLRARRLLNFKFRRQVPIGGKYIVDFLCCEARLIIEVDGSQHSTQMEYDRKRTAWLEKQGFQVVRYWNNEVLGKIDSVLSDICFRLQGV